MKKGSINLLIIFGLLFLIIGITVPYLNWMGGATWYDSVLLLVIFTIIGSLLFLVGRSNQKESNLKEWEFANVRSYVIKELLAKSKN